jgi:integrase/recombinase XerD
LTTASLLKHMSQLSIIAEMLDSDFTVIDKDDMYELVGKIERSDRSDWTKHDYKVTIKRFFRWVNEIVTAPSLSA